MYTEIRGRGRGSGRVSGMYGKGREEGVGLWGRTVNRRGRKSYRHRVEDVMYPLEVRTS